MLQIAYQEKAKYKIKEEIMEFKALKKICQMLLFKIFNTNNNSMQKERMKDKELKCFVSNKTRFIKNYKNKRDKHRQSYLCKICKKKKKGMKKKCYYKQ